MSEIDVTKCRFYLDDGSCCSHDTDCTKCIHCYCDWKVHQEQLQRYKQALENIQDICNVAYRYEVEELQDAFIDIIENAFNEILITSEVENE